MVHHWRKALWLGAGLGGLLACSPDSEPLAPESSDDAADTGPGTSGPGTPASTTGPDATSSTTTGTTAAESGGPDSEGGSTSGVPPVNGSAGCGQTASPLGVMFDERLEVRGISRQYVLSVPEAYDPWRAYPLIFGLHGLNTDGSAARSYLHLEDAPVEAIFVYPSAQSSSAGWQMQETDEDVAYVDALYERVSTHYCVDETRVFATGFSHGGYFSNNLVCWRGDLFRAIAPIGGGGPWYGEPCRRPMPAMIIHGTADDVVPIAQGENARNHWSTQAGCEATSLATSPDPCIAYDGCDAPVVWCAFDGGHSVPAFAGPGVVEFFLGF